MPEGVVEYRVTMDDVLHYQQELETETLTHVVLWLWPYYDGRRWQFRVEARAFLKGEEVTTTPLASAGATYPTRNSPTFPGACLNALMTLYDRIMAQRALKELPKP